MFWNLYLNNIFYPGIMISVDSVVSAGHIVIAVTGVQQAPGLLPAPMKTGYH